MTLSRPVAFVLAGTHIGPMILNRFDQCTAPVSGDEPETFGVSYEMLKDGIYAHKEIDAGKDLLTLLRQYRGDGVVVVDCGANLGTHTVSWAKHILGWGSITAFEPQRMIYYALCGNVALNNCPNVNAYYGAVGREITLLNVPLLDYFKAASFGSLEMRLSRCNQSIGQEVNYANTTQVPMVSIDSLCLPRVDLIKIDVEGMELEVLDGAAQSIERCHPLMMIEWPKAGEQGIKKRLEAFGYDFLNMCPMMLIAIHPDDPIRKHITEEPPAKR